jgi:uncharacterized iron-regulated membrane protein
MERPFWYMVGGSLLLVGSIMGVLAWMARDVPDASEQKVRRRLNPDMIRMLAYALMVLFALLAAMYNLRVAYSAE